MIVDAVNSDEEGSVVRNLGSPSAVQVVPTRAAKRRMGLFQFDRILMSMLFFLEILLIFRFFLRMISANPNSGFAMLLYGVTGVFVGPFNGLIATPTFGGYSFELTTLIAMVVYALAVWGVAYVFRMIMIRPNIRSFMNNNRA